MSDGKSKMILIAGPYRSGTGDDPEKMKNNLRRMEDVALKIFRGWAYSNDWRMDRSTITRSSRFPKGR